MGGRIGPNYLDFKGQKSPKPKIFLAAQIIFGNPNYFWQSKLFLMAQIIFDSLNYFWQIKLFLTTQIIFDNSSKFLAVQIICQPKLFWQFKLFLVVQIIVFQNTFNNLNNMKNYRFCLLINVNNEILTLHREVQFGWISYQNVHLDERNLMSYNSLKLDHRLVNSLNITWKILIEFYLLMTICWWILTLHREVKFWWNNH